MTTPIGSIGSFGAVGAIGATGASDPIAPVMVSGIGMSGTGSALPAASNPDETSDSAKGFAAQLADSLQNLQTLQTRKDELAVKAATGSLTDVHDYTIAATEAALATQLTVAVRDKAVAAFQEIMRMQ
ncbi:flagellar hook-basal body complex protein FliE [Cryptosporangium japonicum]|uniref:Flagellar hook-basal body complex protein FliE n=1 Tax=Cryptosporangium japonicum TaxID=80872 RepID=A0ABN0U9W0_9ACTN